MSSKNRRRGTISYNSRFKMGKLPVEHLVVPLITGKLTIHDYILFLDKRMDENFWKYEYKTRLDLYRHNFEHLKINKHTCINK
jgi:hypothetical protein